MHTLFGAQVPCPPQVGEQTGVLHVAPDQPLLQEQVFGAEQEPFTHAGLQVGVLHVAPDQPLLQVQVPVVQLAFVPQDEPSATGGFEQEPVEGSQVPGA